jgi:integrase
VGEAFGRGESRRVGGPWQVSKRVDPKQTATRVGAILEGCKFTWLSDLDGDTLTAYLARRRREGMAAGTRNNYLVAVKSFAKWLYKGTRVHSPLADLKGLKVDADRRVTRRALSAREFDKLLKATKASPRVVRGLDGLARSKLYLTASMTGWRANELASLSVASLDFERGTVTTEAGYSKHRRRDVLPLHPDLARQLRDWLGDRPLHARLWPGRWAAGRHGGEMVREDLAAAGVAYQDAAGRVFDFHALRGQFITSLARSGVNLVGAQRLARHSTPDLTANVYTHLDMDDMRADLAKLPKPPAVIPPRRRGRTG